MKTKKTLTPTDENLSKAMALFGGDENVFSKGIKTKEESAAAPVVVTLKEKEGVDSEFFKKALDESNQKISGLEVQLKKAVGFNEKIATEFPKILKGLQDSLNAEREETNTLIKGLQDELKKAQDSKEAFEKRLKVVEDQP